MNKIKASEKNIKKISPLKSRINITLIYFVAALAIEFITILSIRVHIPQYFLFNLAVLLVLTGILFIIPFRPAMIVFAVSMLTSQSVISVINVIMSRCFDDIYTFELIFMFGDAIAAFSPMYLNIWHLIGVIFIGIGASTLMFWQLRSVKRMRLDKLFLLYIAFIAVTMQAVPSLCVIVYSQKLYGSTQESLLYDDAYLVKTLYNKTEAFDKLGTFGLYYYNLSYIMFPPSDEDLLLDAKNYFSAVGTFTGNDFSDILGDTKTKIITLMCESLGTFGIDEYLTPNLYALMNGSGTAAADYSVNFSGYYSKSRTNITEYCNILGSFSDPVQKGISYADGNVLSDNNFGYSLPNILRQDGYITNYIHSFDGSIYSRNIIMPRIGFDNFFDVNDMSSPPLTKFGEFLPDSKLLEFVCDNVLSFDGSTLEYTYITTVASHATYQQTLYKNLQYSDLYKEFEDAVADSCFAYPEDFSDIEKEYLKNYMVTIMDLDKGIGYLLDNIDWNTTTLLLFSDHNVYGNDLDLITLSGDRTENKYNPQIFNVPYVIVNKPLREKIDALDQADRNAITGKFISYNDTLPTLLNLLGKNFNKNIYMGSSVFEDSGYGVQVSYIGGYFNQDYFTLDGKKILFSRQEISETEKKQFQNSIVAQIEKQRLFDMFYKYNLYADC